MKRSAWLILVVAAQLGLGAPLCGFACSEPPAAAHASSERAPCHESAPASSPDPVPPAHECECDRLQLGVTKGDPTHSARANLALAAPLATSPVLAPAPFAPRIESPSGRGDLPPPDILLLKSTLLL